MGLPAIAKQNGLTQTNGRQAAISTIDSIMGDSVNLTQFRNRLQKAFTEDPIRFFQELVMPLIPKNHSLSTDSDKGIDINIIMKGSDTKKISCTDPDGNIIDITEAPNEDVS